MGAFLVALAIGLVILFVTIRVVRMIAAGPPPEPDPDAVEEVALDYRCSVCGMQLTITHAQGEETEPPRHCREDMLPVG